jgi:hypothetical protein
MGEVRWSVFSRASRASVTAVVLLCLAPALAVAEPPGAESPQALVDRMKRAAEKEDLGEIVACLSGKARGEMTMGLYMGATMMVAFSQMGVEMGGSMAESLGADASAEDKKKAEAQLAEARAQAAKLQDGYNAVMAKHGLPAMPKEGEPEPEISEQDLAAKFERIDTSAFATDVLGFMKSMPGAEEQPASESTPVKLGSGVIADLAIDGDTARGTIDGEPVRFVRENGRWFFDAEEPAEPAAAEEGATTGG